MYNYVSNGLDSVFDTKSEITVTNNTNINISKEFKNTILISTSIICITAIIIGVILTSIKRKK